MTDWQIPPLFDWNLEEAADDALSPSFTYISAWGLPDGPDGPVHVKISLSGGEITCESAGYRISLPRAELALPFVVEDDARKMYGRYIDLLMRRHTEITMGARSLAKVGDNVKVAMPALYLKNLLILVRYAHVFLLLWGQLTGGEVDSAAMREVIGMAETFSGIATGFRGTSKVRDSSP